MEVLAVDLIAISNQVYSITMAALGLGLVIFLHELGHFAVAKWCDVNVERFSIGFGPVLFSRKWGETEYALSLFPFGGYVKMLGQDDADPSQLTNEEIAEDPRSYVAKTVFQRMAIISAGVTMNILTAFLFFIVVFLAGFPDSPSIIGDSRPGMPAWEAGIEAGDVIERINDERITTFADLTMKIALSWGALKFEGHHADGKPFQITVEPDTKDKTHPQIGVTPAKSLFVRLALPGYPVSSLAPTFRRGDMIKSVNDHELKDSVDFYRTLATNQSGTLSIKIDRTMNEKGERLEKKFEETINIPDNYFRTLGLILDSGPIEAMRAGSPAEKAGLKKGDKLAQIDGLNIGTEIDPLKLPVEFAKRAGREITVVVTRQNIGGGQEKVEVKLTPNDVPGWLDKPEHEKEPLAIPSIGVAFHLLPVILAVEPDSPAEKAGIKRGNIKSMSFVKRVELPNSKDEEEDSPFKVNLDDSSCAFAFWKMQRLPLRAVRLTVVEDGVLKEVEVAPQLDKSWPLPMVPVVLDIERMLQKAQDVGEACSMSVKQTRTSVINIYLTLRSLLFARVSYKELHGPLGIAQTAYRFAQEGWVTMLLFLGFLSVNLAVLNFLPIPVLDGGHMVFLLWEAFTRRKPNEKLQIGATYVGFAFLLCLMALVLYLDLFVHPFSKK